MSLLRVGARRLNPLLIQSSTSTIYRTQTLFPRHFSTESNAPPPPSPPAADGAQPQPQSQLKFPVDAFLHKPFGDVVYATMTGISKTTLKTDVINLFDDCKLTPDDMKVDYSRLYAPIAMLVKFPSFSDFTAAIRSLTKRVRLYRLDKVDRQLWDDVPSYDGRWVLFRGIPRNAVLDDVELFLKGCKHHSSSVEIFTRPTPTGLVRMAKVQFPSKIEAMNAVIHKNGALCLNSRVVAQLLQ